MVAVSAVEAAGSPAVGASVPKILAAVNRIARQCIGANLHASLHGDDTFDAVSVVATIEPYPAAGQAPAVGYQQRVGVSGEG